MMHGGRNMETGKLTKCATGDKRKAIDCTAPENGHTDID